MIKKINFLFLTLFGIGKIKTIPGSFASLATTFFLFFYFIFLIFPQRFFCFFLLIIFILSIFAINNFVKNSENKDPKEIVIDEFIGQSIPISLFEIAHDVQRNSIDTLKFYFIMFILFRIFDITKPYPANYYEKNFKNGFGVIMDDICAGLYVVALLVLYMILK